MKLSRLIEALPDHQWIGRGNAVGSDNDPDISSLHYQSRTVLPGGIFVAVKGFSADGHLYVEDALNRGAGAIIAEHRMDIDAVQIVVKDTRKALAEIADCFYSHPSHGLCLIGVTGTNGKTTVTYLVESLLQRAGINAGVIGTVNYRYGGKIFENPMTTPESLELQKILSEMKAGGVTHVVMEVSSHAIDLHRVHACRFDIGIFTNLTQDHLDYHQDMEQYWSIKKRFFTDYLATGPKSGRSTAVINCNDARGKLLFDTHPATKISVGFSEPVMIGPKEIQSTLSGIVGTVFTPIGDLQVRSLLVGDYNIENILCAIGAGIALKLPLEAVESGIRAASHIPGRLEAVPNTVRKFVYVDYAHTPDALENVLETLAALKTGRMICVFGCGGNRDKGKRPQMGEIATRLSDLAVITTDNPRNEDPMDIIWEIEKGVRKTDAHCFGVSELKNGFTHPGYVVIPDRVEAIETAISAAEPGDIVLIAGKGHENYQIIGDRKFPFDDRRVAEHALKADSRDS